MKDRRSYPAEPQLRTLPRGCLEPLAVKAREMFIDEDIEALFDRPPLREKRPGCPDGFVWRGNTYRIAELLSERHDYHRRGRMAHNMRPAHLRAAVKRGSWGVGRDLFCVRTDGEGCIFELYYDRSPRAGGRKGSWVLFRELPR